MKQLINVSALPHCVVTRGIQSKIAGTMSAGEIVPVKDLRLHEFNCNQRTEEHEARVFDLFYGMA